MHARTATLQVSPDRVDDVVSQLQDQQLPQFREQQGYKGFTVLGDRDGGQVIGISFWESAEARDATDNLGKQAREQASDTGQASGAPEVGKFEVLIDDMV